MYSTILKFIKLNNFDTRHLNGPRHLFPSFCYATRHLFEPLHVYEPGFNTDKYGKCFFTFLSLIWFKFFIWFRTALINFTNTWILQSNLQYVPLNFSIITLGICNIHQSDWYNNTVGSRVNILASLCLLLIQVNEVSHV